MILEHQTAMRASPESVAGFFDAMEDHHTRWHRDHVLFRWIEGRGVAVGNAFYIEERIDGHLLRRAMRFTAVEPARHIEFAPENRLIRLFLPRIVFAIAPEPDGCSVTQRLHIRIGPIGKRLNRRGFGVVSQHMREEGQNMKAMLEAASPGP